MTKEEIRRNITEWYNMVNCAPSVSDAHVCVNMDGDLIVSLFNLIKELDWYDSRNLVSKDDCKRAISSASNKFARLWVGDAYKAIDKLPKVESSKEI